MKKLYFAILLAPFLSFSQAGDYYQGTDNLSGYALKTKLQEILSNKTISWHYDNLGSFYATTDVDRYYENNGSLMDIYSEIPTGPDAYEYDFTQMIGTAGSEGLGWNREHVMPQSSFNSNYPMYSDLLFVIPTDARINQLRNNYPYGIAGAKNHYTFTNSSKINDSAIPNATYTGRVYEPINEFKGDIARMLLYFVVRYQGKLGSFNFDTDADPKKDRNPLNGTEEQAFEKWYIDMLVSWHNADPVSQREKDRNNYVYAIQKNRNPFIDHPEWIQSIFGSLMSTDNLSFSKNFKIYPNPAKGGTAITVQGDNLKKFDKAWIYNLVGQRVQEINQPFKNGNSIQLNNLPKGIYILKTGELNTKFIVD